MKPLRIATRRSPLAQWQARHIADWLSRRNIPTELILLTSEGDIDQRPITDASGRGLFTKRIQDALLHDEADLAVHSLKDLPTEPAPGLTLAAVPLREAVYDCLLSSRGHDLQDLPVGAVVGTGSRRRGAQLLYQRPDLKIEPIRGNVDTRIRKMHDGLYDAIVLAGAGLKRLELNPDGVVPLSLEMMLPAPGQGALGIEVRADDTVALDALRDLGDAATTAAVTAERALLRTLQGGCLAPIAALGTVVNERLLLRAVVLAADGSQRVTMQDESHFDEAETLGIRLAQSMIEQGARDLVVEARHS